MRFLNTFGRRLSATLLNPPARFIGRLGVSPAVFTLLGLALAGAAGLAFAYGRLRTAAVLILAAGSADMIDGAVARVAARTSRFGAFLDSVTDRYGEAAYLTGLIYYYAAAGDEWKTLTAAVVLSGSFLVSYVKARAQSLGENCDVGLMERPERMLLLALGYLVGGYGGWAALLLLAVFSHITALQRVFYARKALAGK